MKPRPEVWPLYGLRVESAIPLHLNRAAIPDGQADVRITLGEARSVPDDAPDGRLLAEFASPDYKLFTFVERTDGHYVLRFHGAIDFDVSPDLSELRAYFDPDVDPDLTSVITNGTVMSFLLMMKGEPLLHGSAVDIGGRALAFVGFSGMGKSTMATLMCAGGATLVTDDVLRLDMRNGGVRCHLGATETRLRKSASELLSAFADSPGHRRTGDERDALQLRASTNDLLPLAAIVLPRPRHDTDQVILERLQGTKALLALASFPRIMGWEDAASAQGQFQHLGDLVERVPVFVADVPWGPPFQPDIAAQVLQGIGLADSLAAVR